jgi:hypothetical protein
MKLGDFYTSDLHDEGAEVNITNPSTGEVSDVFIRVKGPDSKDFREAILRMNRSGIESTQADLVSFLTEITMDWRGVIDGKQEVEFTKDVIRDVYNKSPDVANQVMAFVGDRQNFMKG